MITLQDWSHHCTKEIPLYYYNGQNVEELPISIAIAFDRTLEDFVVCFATRNTTFKDVYKTRLECAMMAAENLIKSES